MNKLLKHDVLTLSTWHEHFKPIILGLFGYLNGTVNTINICECNIAYFSDQNYAQFQYPNKISIFLSSILDHFCNHPIKDFDTVMSVAAVTIVHELYHADQIIDTHKYCVDDAYCKNTEIAAEYNAELFCYTHKREFKKKFGFNYQFNIKEDPSGVYYKIDKDHFYIQSLIGLFRNVEIGNEVKNLLEKHDNVMFRVNTSQNDTWYTKILKADGEIKFTREDIIAFNQILMMFRHGISSCNYMMDYNIMEWTLKDNSKVYCFDLTIVDYTYNPFHN